MSLGTSETSTAENLLGSTDKHVRPLELVRGIQAAHQELVSENSKLKNELNRVRSSCLLFSQQWVSRARIKPVLRSQG